MPFGTVYIKGYQAKLRTRQVRMILECIGLRNSDDRLSKEEIASNLGSRR